jgi:hypothetical protein
VPKELLGPICLALALEIVHLRWIVWTQWTCKAVHRRAHRMRLQPSWLKHLL